MSGIPSLDRATVPCPDCHLPMPLRAAVMCLHLDGLTRVHAPCPMCGPRVTGPLTTAEQVLLRRIGVMEATQRLGDPEVQLPDDTRTTPHRGTARPERLPEAATRPWTRADLNRVMDGIYGRGRWHW